MVVGGGGRVEGLTPEYMSLGRWEVGCLAGTNGWLPSSSDWIYPHFPELLTQSHQGLPRLIPLMIFMYTQCGKVLTGSHEKKGNICKIVGR